MSQEKPGGSQEPVAAPQKEDKPRSNKPVVHYILILFIAAFLLMALSFLMHQRSNTEALGALQSSVTAMQEVQAAQEHIIALQEELAEKEEQLDALQKSHEEETQATQAQLAEQKKSLEAMTNLYLLQQAYSSGNYEACQTIIQGMEELDQVEALTIEGAAAGNPSEGLIFPPFYNPPRLRFDQLKEAVEAKLAENPAP